MKSDKFYIAASDSAISFIDTSRVIVSLTGICHVNNLSAVVLGEEDLNLETLSRLENRIDKVPVIALINDGFNFSASLLQPLSAVFKKTTHNKTSFNLQLENLASLYEENILPPFFQALKKYVEKGNITFACPGHQGTAFFNKHPAGRQFVDFFGENIFRADVPHADPILGEMLTHNGVPKEAQRHAAKVFNADKTYFVLNGTSTANKIVTSAILTSGDLVLFDRNNHKSCYHGALIQSGATPVYLEATRNIFGLIGGVPEYCFNESYLRQRIHEVAPDKSNKARPFRLAVLQQGTCDGTIYNTKYIIEKIGKLCDYILFDSAWVGYEQFIPMMCSRSPLLLELNGDSPGIIVTQSVHKQLAGFSQSSQIHKKDSHIREEDHYCGHKKFNYAFMLHASTSPFYPIFSALDINAKMHSNGAGERLWQDCVRVGIEARKLVLALCKYIKPFIPDTVDGKPWQSFGTDLIASDINFFTFLPNEKWHQFSGYGKDQYLLDPCKLLLTTPGITKDSGYDDFGIPAIFLAYYLRDNGIVPEKSDLNSIVFLLTPASDLPKMIFLVSQLVRFEQHIEKNSSIKDVLPSVYYSNPSYYDGYNILDLCHKVHQIYSDCNFQNTQRDMFSELHLPTVAILPSEAHAHFIRGNVELIPIEKVNGRIAAEAALPYPPGIVCIAPGERWGGAVLKYFQVVKELINLLPDFSPDMQGVYIDLDNAGLKTIFCYVIKE